MLLLQLVASQQKTGSECSVIYCMWYAQNNCWLDCMRVLWYFIICSLRWPRPIHLIFNATEHTVRCYPVSAKVFNGHLVEGATSRIKSVTRWVKPTLASSLIRFIVLIEIPYDNVIDSIVTIDPPKLMSLLNMTLQVDWFLLDEKQTVIYYYLHNLSTCTGE